MHELSISQAIADLVVKEADKREAKKVLRIQLEIGELSLLNPEQVEFCLGLALERTCAAEAELRIESVKPEIFCHACDYEGTLQPKDEVKDDPLYHLYAFAFKCPRCGSGEITVKRGRECKVKEIEILT